MEDRDTPGLYLEMSDAAPAQYGADRAPLVGRRPGITRASWWRTTRERNDLPRRLPHFTTLGVYELDAVDTFAAPSDADAHRGLHFLRTPRPGQGRLTALPTRGLSLVLISPKDPDQSQALRDWGDFVHINHIAAAGIEHLTMITPYEHSAGTGATPRYLHCYESDSGDPDPVFDRLAPAVAERLGPPGTPAYDDWARHPQLRIEYVNALAHVGELS